MRLFGRFPDWLLIAEERNIAVMSVHLAIEPAMDDDTILGPALVEAVIPNERSWWQISAVSVLIVDHVVSFLSSVCH